MTPGATKQLFIHCGLHKTGTSYLQHVLAVNRDKLARIGVIYPHLADLGFNLRFSDHNHLVSQLMATAGEAAVIRQLLAPIDHIMSLAGVSKVILSAEEFGHLLLRDDLRQPLLAALAGYDLRLVFYLRRQDALKESVFAEVVKGLYYGPIATENHYQYDLLARFTPLLEDLDRDALILRPYNRSLWPQQSIIQDFQHSLGLPPDLVLRAPKKALNVSLPRPLTYLLSRSRTVDQKTRLKHFHQLHQQLFDDPHQCLMPPPARATFQDGFAASNAAFANAVGIDDIAQFLGLDTILEPDWQPLPQPFHAFADRWLD